MTVEQTTTGAATSGGAAVSPQGDSEERWDTDFDHHSTDYRDHMIETWTELRSTCPVARNKAHDGFWVMTDFESVFDVVSNDELFSSLPAAGIPAPVVEGKLLPIESDPPDTQEYRKMTLPAFTPALARAAEPRIRRMVNEHIDDFIESGSADLVRDLAIPIPARVTLQMFDFDESEWPEWIELVHILTHDRTNPDRAPQAYATAGAKVGAEMARRARDGFGDDLLSRIMQGTVHGRPMTEGEIMTYSFLVMFGGLDTTAGLTASALLEMHRRPELRRELIEDRSLLPKATEEFLRVHGSLNGLVRNVTRDTVVKGRQLRAGDRILLLLGAADRDPAMFDRPDEVDFHRTVNRHMAFGVGAHRCLGSNIARVMFQVMIDEILNRIPDYEVDVSGVELFDDVAEIVAYRHLPVTFTPGTRTTAG